MLRGIELDKKKKDYLVRNSVRQRESEWQNKLRSGERGRRVIRKREMSSKGRKRSLIGKCRREWWRIGQSENFKRERR